MSGEIEAAEGLEGFFQNNALVRPPYLAAKYGVYRPVCAAAGAVAGFFGEPYHRISQSEGSLETAFNVVMSPFWALIGSIRGLARGASDGADGVRSSLLSSERNDDTIVGRILGLAGAAAIGSISGIFTFSNKLYNKLSEIMPDEEAHELFGQILECIKRLIKLLLVIVVGMGGGAVYGALRGAYEGLTRGLDAVTTIHNELQEDGFSSSTELTNLAIDPNPANDQPQPDPVPNFRNPPAGNQEWQDARAAGANRVGAGMRQQANVNADLRDFHI